MMQTTAAPLHHQWWFWASFGAAVLLLLALDLFVAGRRRRAMELKEAVLWSLLWVSFGLLMNALVFIFWGASSGGEFLAAYLIEKSLSVDNLFVFLVIFSSFGIELRYQHTVLFWGVVGAILMRAVCILGGIALLEHIKWVFYVFGAILIFAGLRLAARREPEAHPERSLPVRLLRGLIPVATAEHHGRFIVRERGRRKASALLIALIAIESADLVFAMDSIPAVLAMTKDPFIAYTSNICAVLGLRALYFVLAGVIRRFWLLRIGLCVILVMIGLKWFLAEWISVPVWVWLVFIISVLAASISASLIWKKGDDS